MSLSIGPPWSLSGLGESAKMRTNHSDHSRCKNGRMRSAFLKNHVPIEVGHKQRGQALHRLKKQYKL